MFMTQRNRDDDQLAAAVKEAAQVLKTVAKEAKSMRYEEFCNEVTEDRALHKFWQLYGAMKNKQKTR